MSKKMPCEVFCRIVGYYRPLSNWNAGKKEEYGDRTFFKSKEINTAINMPAPACSENPIQARI